MGTVKAVCVSEAKGVQKSDVGSAAIEADFGIVGDAHAGKWHRQVSLLSFESIEDFKARGAEVVDGSFGENLIIEGIDVKALPIGTKLACNDVRMEITQIGKECHSHCAIYHRMGDCIMCSPECFRVARSARAIRSRFAAKTKAASFAFPLMFLSISSHKARSTC